MKALTVKQPWAWCIIAGGKTVENRGQQWGYRGPLAIHAGQGIDFEAEQDPRVLAAWEATEAPCRSVRGHVIGVVDLTDVHAAATGCCESPWADPAYRGGLAVHLVLENPRSLYWPVQARGMLGLWDLPADVERVVLERALEGAGAPR